MAISRTMQTVAVMSQKGGSGKTTVAAHLAVAAEAAGDGPTVLIDTDPQQTLTTWWELREAATPQLVATELADLGDKLQTLERMQFKLCIIDTPPALTEQNRQLLKLASLVVIPTRPSPNDLWALGATLNLVREANTPFAFLLTQAKGNARISMQSMAALSEHGRILGTVLHDRVDYARAMTDGRTSGELSAKSAAAVETRALWNVTKELIEGPARTTRPTKKRAR